MLARLIKRPSATTDSARQPRVAIAYTPLRSAMETKQLIAANYRPCRLNLAAVYNPMTIFNSPEMVAMKRNVVLTSDFFCSARNSNRSAPV